jgi:hypothetical protein
MESLDEAALNAAPSAYNNGLEKGAFKFDAARFNLALDAYFCVIRQYPSEQPQDVVERVAKAIAAVHISEVKGTGAEIDVARRVEERWQSYREEASAAIAAMRAGDTLKKPDDLNTSGERVQGLKTSGTLIEEMKRMLERRNNERQERSLAGKYEGQEFLNGECNAWNHAIMLASGHEQRGEIRVVNEKEVRKRIASELTRCAESAESHDWNNQTHRQRMVNAIIIALRPYLREPRQGSGWLPIETAPRDYSWIFIAAFHPDGAMEYSVGSRWEGNKEGTRGFWQCWRGPAPTHWLPMPKLNSIEDGSASGR